MSMKSVFFFGGLFFCLALGATEERYKPFGLEMGATRAELEKSGIQLGEVEISKYGHGPHYKLKGISGYFPGCPQGEVFVYFGRKMDRLWRVLWNMPNLLSEERETVTKRILQQLEEKGFRQTSADNEGGVYILQKDTIMAQVTRYLSNTSGTAVAFFESAFRAMWLQEKWVDDRQWILEKLNKSSCILYPGMSVRYKHFSLDQESGACYMITNRVILKTTGEELEEELSFNLRDTDFNFEEVTALDKGIIILSFKEKTAFLKTRLSGVQDAGKMVTRTAVDICPLEDASYCFTTLGFLKEMLVNGTSLSY